MSASSDARASVLEVLHERAVHTRVAVIGAGAGGLVAARELAKVGMAVTILEAGDRPGGAVRSGEVAGLRLDLGAESFATRGGHVRSLVDELGLGNDVVEPEAGGAWLAGLPGGDAVPLPKGGVLGIPASPFVGDVRRIIGWGGAWRAYLTDRFRPLLTIGRTRSLGKLVRSRLGAVVADRLVAPVTTGVYSADPDDVDPDVVAPGLNAALTRTGSLLGAVGELQQERSTQAKAPGSAVQGIAGGMGRLVDALVDELTAAGVELRTGAAVTGIERDGDVWRVIVADDGVSGRGDASPDGGVPTDEIPDDRIPPDASASDARGPSDAPDDVDAPRYDIVLLATDEATARRILAPHTGLAAEVERPGPVVDVVTLVLDAPVLDDAPRGTGVLVVPGSFRAKALTHATAKWGWVRDAAGGGRHVVRVSFGTQGEPPVTEGRGQDEAAALALGQAEEMLGVELPVEGLLGSRLERYVQSQPAAMAGRREAVQAARQRIRAVPGIGAVGAWLSGTGLAQVIPDAVEEAARLRGAALFDD